MNQREVASLEMTRSPMKPAWVPYALALLGVIAATLIRMPFETVLNGRAPYGLYFPVLALVAWQWGVGPTVFAGALALVAAVYFVVAPAFSFDVPQADYAGVLVYLITASSLVVLARVAAALRKTAEDNVTEARLADAARAHLAAIVESSDDAIVSKDLDGFIRSWNAGAERIFGYRADEIIGRSVRLLLPPEQRGEEDQILARLRRGERVDHLETVRMTKDGRRLDVSLTISPIRDAAGVFVGASKVARDITDQKRAQRLLARQEHEREQLLQSERAARGEAERANRVKDDFVATVSHELRTPLNAILGWAQVLRREASDPETREHGLAVIERNTRLQAQLISDLLDVSRIVSGKLRLEPELVDLGTVVDQALETVRASADAKGLQVNCVFAPGVEPIAGDPARLQQVIWNLLANAVKFTSSGGRIDLRVERRDAHAVITVSDSGAGIRPDFLPHLFDRFRQADASTTRRFGGLGLGLAIVKQLVELHGGTVSAHSEGEGQGATFVVTLPLEAPRGGVLAVADHRKGAEDAGAHVATRLDGLKVIVVEDEPDARDLVDRLLSEAGCSVVAVGSAQDAMLALESERPDVLISDIGLPGEDGYSLIQRVRTLDVPERRALPAIALTAFARSEDRTRALRAGFQAHAAKPVDPAELLATIGSLAAIVSVDHAVPPQ